MGAVQPGAIHSGVSPESLGTTGMILGQCMTTSTPSSPPSTVLRAPPGSGRSAGGTSPAVGAEGRISVRMGKSTPKFSEILFIRIVSMMSGDGLDDSRRAKTFLKALYRIAFHPHPPGPYRVPSPDLFQPRGPGKTAAESAGAAVWS